MILARKVTSAGRANEDSRDQKESVVVLEHPAKKVKGVIRVLMGRLE